MTTFLPRHMASSVIESQYGTHQSGSHKGLELTLEQVCDGCHSDIVRESQKRTSAMMANVVKASHLHPSWIGQPVPEPYTNEDGETWTATIDVEGLHWTSDEGMVVTQS